MGFLAGKTAIITGAGYAKLSNGRCGSIGYGIATAYAKKLNDAKEELERLYGVKVLCVQADVNDSADNEAVVNNVVKQAIDTFGRIDVLINNAQASASGVPLADHTTEQFNLALYSTFYYMKACYPYLKETKGAVINFASGAGLFGNYGQCAYAAAKEGIRGLTRVAATEWGKDGINVNVVCPLAWTTQLENFQKAYPEAFKANVKMPPMGHYGDSEVEIGHVCVHSASPFPSDSARLPCVRPAGFPGLQIHVRRNHHPRRRHGSAPLTARIFAPFCAPRKGVFCTSLEVFSHEYRPNRVFSRRRPRRQLFRRCEEHVRLPDRHQPADCVVGKRNGLRAVPPPVHRRSADRPR